MSTATTLSRATGFLRMGATAYALGATGLMSAYSIANNIPNMIFELVAGGILSSLFIPTFMEVKAERGDDAGWRFASHVFNLVLIALGIVALAGTFLPEPFIWTQTFREAGAGQEAVQQAAEFFFRFFAIQVVFYGAGMVMQALLNAERRYLWPALGPVFNNLVVITTMLVFASMPLGDTSLTLLAVGTTLGVVAMFAVMVPSLVRSGVRYVPEVGLRDPAVRRMLLLAVPTVVYVVTNLVAVSFRNASALAVTPKGPSVLMYAWTFFQLPYGILAVALATAVFTELSEAAGYKDFAGLKNQFARGLRATGVLMLPAAAMLIALAEPLVSLFLYGEFTPEDVPLVAAPLRLWGVGLVFFACMMFVLRTFYSLKDTRTPMLANLALTPVQIGLYVLLTAGVWGWAGLGVNGVPVADGVFWLLMLVTLALLLRKRLGGYDVRGIVATFVRMMVASAAGGLVAYGIATLLAPTEPTFGAAVLQVAIGGSVGLLIAFALGRVLRVPELTVATEVLTRAVRGIRRRSPKDD